MLKRLQRFALLCAVLVLLCAALAFSAGAKGAEDEPLLSPGLSVIAEKCALVVSAAPGGEAALTREDFARAVGYVPEKITLTSRPGSAVGQLTLGGIAIPEGQVITGANIDRISFMPTSAPADESASFTFRADSGNIDYICTVRLRNDKKANTAPTLGTATAAALYSSVPESGICSGTLAAFDPDGDGLCFEITEYPKHGSVLLADSASGRWVYRPSEGYTGRDSFSYTVRDEWGGYADEARVSLTVSRFGAPDFADMEGSAETFARIVTSEGLMSGTVVGGRSHFYPDREVSRSEFTVNLLLAAGFSSDELPKNTLFADDSEIAASAKPFVAKAYELGLTDGWIREGRQVFLPNEPISAAEAARMTARLLGLTAGDATEVSAPLGDAGWAKRELAALCCAGFSIGRGGISSSTALDRASAAELLCGVIKITEERK